MRDRVYLNALFDLAVEEAASGGAWFLPEAQAVLYTVLSLSQSADPHWRFATRTSLDTMLLPPRPSATTSVNPMNGHPSISTS